MALSNTRMRVGGNGTITIPLVDQRGHCPVFKIGPRREVHHGYLQARLPTLDDIKRLPIGTAHVTAAELRIEPLFIVNTAMAYPDTVVATHRVFATGNIEGTLYYARERNSWHSWKRRVETASHPSLRLDLMPLEAGSIVGIQISTRAKQGARNLGVTSPRPCGHLHLFCKLHFIERAPVAVQVAQEPWDNPLKSFLPPGLPLKTTGTPQFLPAPEGMPSHLGATSESRDPGTEALPGYDRSLMEPDQKKKRRRRRKKPMA